MPGGDTWGHFGQPFPLSSAARGRSEPTCEGCRGLRTSRLKSVAGFVLGKRQTLNRACGCLIP